MKAMILAAGLGTRLRPWTLSHPKALVPVKGRPMLEHVILRLKVEGFDRIVVNVHHFADQIVDFLNSHDYGVAIAISDESEALLDTGGGICHATPFLCADDEPFLVHNVDILSNAPLRAVMQKHEDGDADATLLVSDRASNRKLAFDGDMRLCGWHNLSSGEWRQKREAASLNEYAFSGIYAMSPKGVARMTSQGKAFPVMDFFLRPDSDVKGYYCSSLDLIDIGKPETLRQATQVDLLP